MTISVTLGKKGFFQLAIPGYRPPWQTSQGRSHPQSGAEGNACKLTGVQPSLYIQWSKT